MQGISSVMTLFHIWILLNCFVSIIQVVSFRNFRSYPLILSFLQTEELQFLSCGKFSKTPCAERDTIEFPPMSFANWTIVPTPSATLYYQFEVMNCSVESQECGMTALILTEEQFDQVQLGNFICISN